MFRVREVGKLLAFLKGPEPPKGFRDLFDKLPQFKQSAELYRRNGCAARLANRKSRNVCEPGASSDA